MTRVALAVLILLAPAATAWAECAWIVWSHATGPNIAGNPVDRYELLGAHPTRNDCLKIVRGYAEVMKEQGLDASSAGASETGFVTGTQGERSMKIFCLPDTVDPRAPKEK